MNPKLSLRHPRHLNDSYVSFDIGLIKLERPFEPILSINGTHYEFNTICLPIQKFEITGTQLATGAGSGPQLGRIKIGPMTVYEYFGDFTKEFRQLEHLFLMGTKLCPVSTTESISQSFSSSVLKQLVKMLNNAVYQLNTFMGDIRWVTYTQSPTRLKICTESEPKITMYTALRSDVHFIQLGYGVKNYFLEFQF